MHLYILLPRTFKILLVDYSSHTCLLHVMRGISQCTWDNYKQAKWIQQLSFMPTLFPSNQGCFETYWQVHWWLWCWNYIGRIWCFWKNFVKSVLQGNHYSWSLKGLTILCIERLQWTKFFRVQGVAQYKAELKFLKLMKGCDYKKNREGNKSHLDAFLCTPSKIIKDFNTFISILILHISTLAKSASKKLGVLWRLRPLFSPSQLLALYRGLICPCMEYYLMSGLLTQFY